MGHSVLLRIHLERLSLVSYLINPLSNEPIKQDRHYFVHQMESQASDLSSYLNVLDNYALSCRASSAPRELTKWGIKEAELHTALVNRDWKTAHDTAAQLAGLVMTNCGLTCETCSTELLTEADFARHFVINFHNRMVGHLNLGECPMSDKGGSIIGQWAQVNHR